MLRYITIVCVLVFALVSYASAQQYQDVVYLKNGSIIRGIIIEQIPGDSLKIQTTGGSIFVFKMSEVLKIAKESTKESSMMQTALKNEKSPGLALLCSFLIVGAGQAYNEEYDKAIVHFIVAIVSLGVVINGWEDNYTDLYGIRRDPDDDDAAAGFGLLIGFGNWIYSMVDAHQSAERINAKRRNNPGISIIDDRLFLEPYSSRKERGAMLSVRF